MTNPTPFLLPVSRPLVRFWITYEPRQPHVPSNALALHLVPRLPSHDAMWLSVCLSFTYGYAARFHLHSSHVLVLLFLYCSYMPLPFACGLSGPHPLTRDHATWPVFVIIGHIMQWILLFQNACLISGILVLFSVNNSLVNLL